MTVAGAVLAGGRSRRMGQDKATIEVGGRRMIDRVVDAVVATGCDPVCVIGGDRAEIGPAPARFVADRHPGEGPLGALLTAFADLDDAAAILMVPCDVPFASPDAFRPLVARWVAEQPHSEIDVVVARTDRLEPMCAVWGRRTVPLLDAAFRDGERSLRVVLAALTCAEVRVEAALLRNVNTPGDLDEARRTTGRR